MLFKFQKYIHPTHYFNLKNRLGKSVYPRWNQLPEPIKNYAVWDDSYTTEEISALDASWQLVQKGYMGTVDTYDFTIPVSITDEYRFVKKYFHPFWSFYVLMIRILTLHNPVREIYSFFKNKKVKKINVYTNPVLYPEWDTFESTLVNEVPKVSVIIPTLNRYDYLKDVLQDLERQSYSNFDVIVMDQTDPFQEPFYKPFNLRLKVYYQQEKALWLARNTAIKTSEADYFLLFDDDSRVHKDWIVNHLKCLDYFHTNISSGTSISVIGAKVPESYSYFKWSDQIDTGNVMIKRDVFEKIGLFDRQFEKQRMGDGEFGLRAYLYGFTNVSNPHAQRLHLKVESGGLRQMGSWDGFRPKNWFAPRPIPSVVYLFRKYYGNTLTRYALLKSVPPSLLPYRYKNSSRMMFWGYVLAIILFPIVLYQVSQSWTIASGKLKEGPKIDEL